jgi:hypothetical protein
MEPDARYAKTLYATADAFDRMAKGKYPDRILAMAGMFALRALLAEGRFEQDIVVGEQGPAIFGRRWHAQPRRTGPRTSSGDSKNNTIRSISGVANRSAI